MNRHSRLLGNAIDQRDGQQERGQRAYCSDRGRRGGCGGTFSFFFATVLPRHSVPSVLLARLLIGLLSGAALNAVVETLRSPFALETFYRLRKRIRHGLSALRVELCRAQCPPSCEDHDPLNATTAHVQAVIGTCSDVVASFQQRFQRPFLG